MLRVLLILLLLFPLSIFSKTIIFSYRELTDSLLLKHPAIRKAEYDIDLAAFRELDAKYQYTPTISLSLYGFPIAPDIYKTHEGNLVFNYKEWKPGFGSKIDFSIPIYTFGRISNAKKAAHYNKLIKEKDFQITHSNIIQQVKNIYWGYLSVNSFEKYIFDVIVPKFKKLVDENETKFMNGEISRFTLEDSRVDYMQIKTQHISLDQERKKLNNKLRILSQDSIITNDTNIEFKVKYLYPLKLDLEPYIYYLNIARKNNQFLKKAEYQELLAQHMAAYKKADIWPILGFATSFAYNYFDFYYPKDGSSIYPSNGAYFSIGFFLKWNLSLWKTINKRKSSETEYLKNVEDLKYNILLLENNLSDTYEDLKFQQQQLKNKYELVKIAQRSLIFITRGINRDSRRSDIASAINKLFRRLQDYYKAIRTFNLSVARFESMLGKNIVNYEAQEQEEIDNE